MYSVISSSGFWVINILLTALHALVLFGILNIKKNGITAWEYLSEKKTEVNIEYDPVQRSGNAYTVISPTKVFRKRDTNSHVVKVLSIGEQVNFRYACKEGETLWHYVRANIVDLGWCKAEYLNEIKSSSEKTAKQLI
jgi:hypothetical protein